MCTVGCQAAFCNVKHICNKWFCLCASQQGGFVMPYNPALGLLKKCNILFEDEVISDGLIMSTFTSYIARLMDGAEKSTNLIYHTGSQIFTVTTLSLPSLIRITPSNDPNNTKRFLRCGTPYRATFKTLYTGTGTPN